MNIIAFITHHKIFHGKKLSLKDLRSPSAPYLKGQPLFHDFKWKLLTLYRFFVLHVITKYNRGKRYWKKTTKNHDAFLTVIFELGRASALLVTGKYIYHMSDLQPFVYNPWNFELNILNRLGVYPWTSRPSENR